jgi:agmatine/peptidylarginine deiminase
MKKKDYEKIFAAYLGATNVIWLGSGTSATTPTDTDDITRFVSPDTVVTCVTLIRRARITSAAENIRRPDATTKDGNPLATIDLPMPAPVYFDGGGAASYANFYIANGIVGAGV